MYELIKHRLVPGIEHSACFESRSQAMRSKCSQCDCEEAKRSCDSKKQYGHCYYVIPSEVEESQILVSTLSLIPSDFAASPTAFSNRSGLIVGFGESF